MLTTVEQRQEVFAHDRAYLCWIWRDAYVAARLFEERSRATA
jgi:hypothetical protein